MDNDILGGFEESKAQQNGSDILGGFEAPPGALPQAVSDSFADPEKAARAIDLSKRSGVPASIVHADPDKTRRDLIQAQAANAVRNSPAVQAYLTNPMAGK